MASRWFKLVLLFTGVALVASPAPASKCKNGTALLEQSARFHDPSARWPAADLALRIQEPRVSNPERFTVLHLRNGRDEFSMVRQFDIGLIETRLVKDEAPRFLLEGAEPLTASERARLRLSAQRALGYRRFYRTLYGLPMTLSSPLIATIGAVTYVSFDEVDAVRIDVQLAEPVLSDNWSVFLAADSHRLLGIQVFDSQARNEVRETLLFKGSVSVGGMRLPRFRHWYGPAANEYLGSDIVVHAREL